MVEIKAPNIEIEKIERHGFGYKPIDYGEDLSEQYDHQLKRFKPLIKEILTTWDKSTNNDVLLYFEFLRTLFPDIEVTSSSERVIFKFPKKDIKFFPSPETVTRCRRILNTMGIGLPTDAIVMLRRQKRQITLRKYFSEAKKQS